MNTPVHILLVEDNEGDMVLAREAFEEVKLLNSLRIARDGEEALHILNQEARPGGRLPDVILLDINIPKISGFELLKKIRADKILSAIPVIILTSSSAEQDILEAHQSKVTGYITKPIDFAQLAIQFGKIEGFHLQVVKTR